MEETSTRVPDPEGHPPRRPENPNPAGPSGEERDSLGEGWVHLSKLDSFAPGDAPPPKEPGSSVDSDEEEESNNALFESLCSKFQVVSNFKNPAARELLKVMMGPAEAFAHLLQEKEQLQAEVAQLKAENQRLQQKPQEQAQAPQEAERRAENQRLQQELQKQAQELQGMALLKEENQRLQQELQEARRSQRMSSLTSMLSGSKTDFHIQVLVTGRTENCETKFLKKVSGCLSDQSINLKTERYREGSGHFLLIFCPVSTRVGTDMENALEGLKGDPKVVLVMMHHKMKESTSFVDTKMKAHHPAVVRTVHACYTIQEGFYACPENHEAVVIVAEVLEDLCKAGKRDLAISGTPPKSRKLH